MTGLHRIIVAGAAALLLPATPSAQVMGTFRWQLRPYCNVVTLVVSEVGGVYRLEGTDDQCGAATAASATGTAFQNPDGSIGLGLNVVTTPGGMASPIDAVIDMASLSGSWRGAGGASGAFVLTPGRPTAGAPRPIPGTAAVPPAILLLHDGSMVARTTGDGAIPASGSGSRMMWYAAKSAFRAGRVEPGIYADRWDAPLTGLYSAALGLNTSAQGTASVALGDRTLARGAASLAAGSTAGAYQFASVALGDGAEARADASLAVGYRTSTNGVASAAIGDQAHATGEASLATGSHTFASGPASFVGGRSSHTLGQVALAFGESSSANGSYSVALGSYAETGSSAPGSFVFADHSAVAPFTSTLPNEFGARFAGGFYLYTRSDLSRGVALAPGGSSWAALSDANAKERFRDVDGEDLLARLARVPVREWSYKGQDAGIRHMGPTAQDFRAAFGLGDFPLRINTVDADGVALAGVKALDARTRALQEENAALRAATEAVHDENVALQEALAALRQEVETLRNRPGRQP
jgi:hypothetical protein